MTLPNIPFNDLKFEEKIGTGHFGEVWRARLHGKLVAVKILKPEVESIPQELITKFNNEVRIVSGVPHPNVVQFMGISQDRGHLMIVTEFMERGDAEKKVFNKEFSIVMRMNFARDVACAVAWIHSLGIIHRDIKLANMLIAADNSIKMCDFGLSALKEGRQYLRDRGYAKGTPLYMAPEVLKGQNFNESSDIYSFGLVLWELVAQREVFSGTYVDEYSVEEFRDEVINAHLRPTIDENMRLTYPPRLFNIMERCWAEIPASRPSFDQLIPELEAAIIEIAIADEFGREIWKNICKKEGFKLVHSWPSFKTHLYQAVAPFRDNTIEEGIVDIRNINVSRLNDLQLDMLRAYGVEYSVMVDRELNARYGNTLLISMDRVVELEEDCIKAIFAKLGPSGEENDFIVSVERFGHMLTYFGPVLEENKSVLFPDRVRRLLFQEWFHGETETAAAENLINQFLKDRADKPFLVRLSSTKPGNFVVTRVTPDNIVHERIQYISSGPLKGYTYDKKRYCSIEALVNHNRGEHWGLAIPCPGSVYQRLFRTTQGQYYNDPSASPAGRSSSSSSSRP